MDTAQARPLVDEPGVGREHRQAVFEGDATDDLVERVGIFARPEQESPLGELLAAERGRLVEDVDSIIVAEQVAESDHRRVVLGVDQVTDLRSRRPGHGPGRLRRPDRSRWRSWTGPRP